MYGKYKFICPHCGTGTNHTWYTVFVSRNGYMEINAVQGHNLNENFEEGDIALSVCNFCDEPALWENKELKFPDSNLMIPDPNEDMPDNIKEIYEEARAIFHKSSRSSAALLRLAMETLLTELGYNQNRLVDKIKAMIESEGATEELVMSAEIIRLYGNSSAHGGFINLNEDKEAAEELFMVLNIIAENQFTRPKRLKSLMDRLPETKKVEVEKRIKEVKK